MQATNFIASITYLEKIMSSLAGKTAFITGASRGIGRATAKRLAREGAFVILHYGASEEAARSLFTEITAAG